MLSIHLQTTIAANYGVQLAVRMGIHTGAVVVGEMGSGDRHELLALGETPNIAARLEGLAQANTVVISPVTAKLVRRSFVLQELGRYPLKGVAESMMLYSVVSPREPNADDHESIRTGDFDVLVGRDEEIGLLLRRWEQSKARQGQVVLMVGEAGLGKSSLVAGLQRHVSQEGDTCMTFHCSPYTANSTLYPVIEHIGRILGWQHEDSVESKLAKLEQCFSDLGLPLDDSVPLIAGLLSLSLPEGRYAALSLSPQQQRQRTHDILLTWLLAAAERQPLLAVWEDLHWADPSTLELLRLLIDAVPTVAMMPVLTYRPEFVPPWPPQSHVTSIALNRLERAHVKALATRLTGGKTLPPEVMAHIVTKTDGIPLYLTSDRLI